MYFLMIFIVAFLFFVESVHARTINSADTFCRVVANHQKGSDVDYKPGVDVRGNAVVPADINPPMQVGETPLVIPIEIDVLNRLELFGVDGLEADAQMGQIEMFQDGSVTFNGQDITMDTIAICSEAILTEQKSHGQKGANPIKIETETLDNPSSAQEPASKDIWSGDKIETEAE